jgi:hypothetical protein
MDIMLKNSLKLKTLENAWFRKIVHLRLVTVVGCTKLMTKKLWKLKLDSRSRQLDFEKLYS